MFCSCFEAGYIAIVIVIVIVIVIEEEKLDKGLGLKIRGKRAGGIVFVSWATHAVDLLE